MQTTPDPTNLTDIVLKILALIAPLLTVIIGVWQFNKGQQMIKEKEIDQRNFEIKKLNQQYIAENRKKFKENQWQLYIETSRVISFLANSKNTETDEYQSKIRRFWELYWVELSVVESKEIEAMMKDIGDNIIKPIENNLSRQQNVQMLQEKLQKKGYDFAQIIKREFRDENSNYLQKISQ